MATLESSFLVLGRDCGSARRGPTYGVLVLGGPWPIVVDTGNHGVSKSEEKAAIKKLLSSAKFLLPVHDKPAKIAHGQVVGRMDMAVPGPVVQSLPARNWFAA